MGIPASISRTGLITLRTRDEAYSLRYNELINPIGRPMTAAMPATNSVPVNSGNTPKCLSSNCGVHRVSVKNSTGETC